MQRTDHSHTGTPHGHDDGQPEARGRSHVDAADVRRIVGFVALVSASFDGALRQLDPSLTLSQYAALEAINRAGRLRPFRLASQQRISRQLAWQTCKRLESLGLVAFEGMEAGKRGVEVTATPAGAAHLDGIASLLDRLAERLGEPGAKGERFEPHPTRRGLRLLAHAAGALQDEAETAAGADSPDAPAESPAPRRKRVTPQPPPAPEGGAMPWKDPAPIRTKFDHE
ncbi:hypothetical protein DRW48_07710 [Paracoccus suum]|uniref:HTH marR-type domain-containing protein n=1 Tax=Paracoccus suum TaxID=2259340 RepID=A0A344PJN7_9RHOB|nr:MarR family transcriptional regulator [Paracoccus suum]AXC49592.1 hypothetical protein DRW48_07710 [Paracoccus suum]